MGQYLYCGGNKQAEIALSSLSERCMDFRDNSSVVWTSHKYSLVQQNPDFLYHSYHPDELEFVFRLL